jgi:predicted RNase H-like nuclease (RuvC/YqgF family)
MNNEEKILGMLERMQADLSDVKTKVGSLDQKVGSLDQKLDALDQKVEQGFRETREVVFQVVELVDKRMDRLEASIKDEKDVVAQNAFDIQLLKKKAQ